MLLPRISSLFRGDQLTGSPSQRQDSPAWKHRLEAYLLTVRIAKLLKHGLLTFHFPSVKKRSADGLSSRDNSADRVNASPVDASGRAGRFLGTTSRDIYSSIEPHKICTSAPSRHISPGRIIRYLC